MKSTLRTYYRRKQESYAEYYPDFHDFHLNLIFQADSLDSKNKAHQVVNNCRKTIIDYVSLCTGEKKYVISGVLKDIMCRCRDLDLYVKSTEADALMRVTAYVTSLTMNYLYTGRFKKAKK
jgi:hypothetical protein